MAEPQMAQQDLPSGGHHTSHTVWTVHAGHHHLRNLQPSPRACQAALPAARSLYQAESPACLIADPPPRNSMVGVEWTMTTKHLPQQPGVSCQGHLMAH